MPQNPVLTVSTASETNAGPASSYRPNPVVNLLNATISTTLTGSADWSVTPPAGFDTNINRLIIALTANATLTGLAAVNDGTKLLIVVTGGFTLSMTGQAAANASGNFFTSGTITASGGLLVYVAGQGWVFT